MFKSECTPCDGPFISPPMIRLRLYRKLFSGPLLRNPETIMDKIVDVAEALSKISSVTQLIRNGGVIALPTDTVYGVACSIDSAQALMRIQQLKGRSLNKPMAICVDKVSRIPHWCDTTGLPDGLLNDLLPGPVTVLLPRLISNHCLDRPHLNPGVQMVGVRVPDHGFIQSLVSALSETEPNGSTHGDHVSPGHPLVLTSANLSGNASALTIEEFSSIWPTLDLIIDGGVIPGADPNDFSPPSARSGSTIVDLSQASKKLFRITRDGSIGTHPISINRTVDHLVTNDESNLFGLIAKAILSTDDRRMILSEIYQWIQLNYPYFRTRGPGWRNSIRHNLSLNDCFIKVGRAANGKGHYWGIHPANLRDFMAGDYRRRRAQRKVRQALGLTCPADDRDTPSPQMNTPLPLETVASPITHLSNQYMNHSSSLLRHFDPTSSALGLDGWNWTEFAYPCLDPAAHNRSEWMTPKSNAGRFSHDMAILWLSQLVHASQSSIWTTPVRFPATAPPQPLSSSVNLLKSRQPQFTVAHLLDDGEPQDYSTPRMKKNIPMTDAPLNERSTSALRDIQAINHLSAHTLILDPPNSLCSQSSSLSKSEDVSFNSVALDFTMMKNVN
ncbi:hypothetical protein P879_08484 [Paragonimus westermani]|uniref:Threonylcarbamoyl-AMP synthase n=1 Tax=Paragonimus westermani TaxID=34504 RepID=A0A8T0DHW9_9TREM|nr:hypothetical protein P879_08484 [Paragonimus westermani]